LEDFGIDGKISKWSLKKQSVRRWNGFFWLRIRSGGRLL
jgi:hypothetical protein